MRRAVLMAVPWLFLLAVAAVVAVVVVPRLVWPAAGSFAIVFALVVLIGPYVVAALTHSADVLRGLMDPGGGPSP